MVVSILTKCTVAPAPVAVRTVCTVSGKRANGWSLDVGIAQWGRRFVSGVHGSFRTRRSFQCRRPRRGAVCSDTCVPLSAAPRLPRSVPLGQAHTSFSLRACRSREAVLFLWCDDALPCSVSFPSCCHWTLLVPKCHVSRGQRKGEVREERKEKTGLAGGCVRVGVWAGC